MPEELKVAGSDLTATKVKLDDEGVVSSWSTGIAEVQLPMSYKLQNIQETERAANNAMMYNQNFHGKAVGFQRFQINDSTAIKQPLEYIAGGLTHLQEGHNNKRPLKSSDDAAVQRYKVS
jgi:hypothetical protein